MNFYKFLGDSDAGLMGHLLRNICLGKICDFKDIAA